MDGHLKFADFFWIFIIVAAVALAAQWWFKKKCSCTAGPRLAGQPGQPPAPSRRPGVMSCA